MIALRRLLLTPVVHPWMLRPPEATRALVGQLDALLIRHAAAIDRLTAALDTALDTDAAGLRAQGGPLGRPRDADRADPAPDPAGRRALGHSPGRHLADTHCALRLTREAFAGLADTMEARVPPLLTALEELARVDPWRWRRVRALRREIREHTDALSVADSACRRGLEAAVRLVPTTRHVNAAGGWVAGLTGSPVTPATPLTPAGATSAVGSATEALAALTPASSGADAATLRRRLGTRPAEWIAAHLRLHPETAEILAASRDVPPGLTDALATPAGDPAGTLRRIRAVREVFAALAEDDARRVALLWPALVGPLDGAPVPLRVEANRLLVRVELGRARRSDVELEARATARRVTNSGSWARRLRGALAAAWLGREVIASLVAVDTDLPLIERADLRVRVRLYQSLLYDRVAASGPDPPAAAPSGTSPSAASPAAEPSSGASPAAGPSSGASPSAGPSSGASPAGEPPRLVPRRLLLFEATGRGRIAELWGPWGPTTRRLAVFVPGTGTAVRGFHLPTDVAEQLARADPEAGTAAVAWMGADFPSALFNQALSPRFARRAAGPLRDLLEALDVPPDVPITVIGHSYGGAMVGAAEVAGLRADRVVHVASAGAGPGVTSVGDYPDRDPLGRPRRVRRFALTAPGDPIRFVQGAARWRGRGGLGVDPAGLEGVTVLNCGVWEEPVAGHAAGEPLRGPSGHAAVVARGTTSFRRIAEVVLDRDSSPHR